MPSKLWCYYTNYTPLPQDMCNSILKIYIIHGKSKKTWKTQSWQDQLIDHSNTEYTVTRDTCMNTCIFILNVQVVIACIINITFLCCDNGQCVPFQIFVRFALSLTVSEISATFEADQ